MIKTFKIGTRNFGVELNLKNNNYRNREYIFIKYGEVCVKGKNKDNFKSYIYSPNLINLKEIYATRCKTCENYMFCEKIRGKNAGTLFGANQIYLNDIRAMKGSIALSIYNFYMNDFICSREKELSKEVLCGNEQQIIDEMKNGCIEKIGDKYFIRQSW